MRSFKFAGTAFLLGALVFFQAGCLGPGKNPPTRFYVLSSLYSGETAIDPVADMADVAIGVGPVEFPKFLDRPQIVTRKSEHRVSVSEFHRWAGSFSEDFLRVLAKNISMLLPADRVVAYPWADHFSPSFRIPLTVEQFDGRFEGDVVLNVAWSVRRQKDTNEPVIKHTRIKESVSAEDYEALVAAQSRAIGTLSRAIVDEIERVSNRG